MNFERSCHDCDCEGDAVEVRRVETPYSSLKRALCDECCRERGIDPETNTV